MTAASLRRIDLERNMHRYYRLDIQRDLFGTWCLVSEWGRIGQAGRLRTLPCPTEDDARATFEKQLNRKLRRGYKTATPERTGSFARPTNHFCLQHFRRR